MYLLTLCFSIETLTEIDLKVKPTKIIAGLEPSETNKLLQAIGYAIDKKIDSKEYVKNVNTQSKLSDKTKKASKKNSVKSEKIKGSVREKQSETRTTKPETTNKNTSEGKVSEKIKKKSKKDDNRKEVEKISPSAQKEMQVHKADNKHISDNNSKNSNLEVIEKPNNVDKEITQKNDFLKLKEDISEKNNIADTDTKKERKEELNETTISTDKDVSLENNSVDYEQPRIRSARPKSARPQTSDVKKVIPATIEKLEDLNPGNFINFH